MGITCYVGEWEEHLGTANFGRFLNWVADQPGALEDGAFATVMRVQPTECKYVDEDEDDWSLGQLVNDLRQLRELGPPDPFAYTVENWLRAAQDAIDEGEDLEFFQ